MILNTPATMNMIPPIIAVVDLLSTLLSMKRVHFIPTVETSSATAERKMLSSITALVAWTSPRGSEDIVSPYGELLIDTLCVC